MFVTFEVFKLLKSMEVKASHAQNICSMSVTFWVLKLLRLRESNDVQP